MKQVADTHKHKGLRKAMVEQVRSKGIKDERVLAAIEKIPRHFFIADSVFHDQHAAYDDRPFDIGEGQTISQPYTVAFQTELLDVQKNEKILEIGTGSGYQSCVLAELGAKVFTIERFKNLYQRAKSIFLQLGYNHVKCFFGDGYEGLPLYAPFDKILITAAAPEIPEALKAQLKTGGIMVVPFGEGASQDMLRLRKTDDHTLTEELRVQQFRFVPMLKGKVY
jgi:protein-L-isoaspartate(D-aspartate) O-methyltransferase